VLLDAYLAIVRLKSAGGTRQKIDGRSAFGELLVLLARAGYWGTRFRTVTLIDTNGDGVGLLDNFLSPSEESWLGAACFPLLLGSRSRLRPKIVPSPVYVEPKVLRQRNAASIRKQKASGLYGGRPEAGPFLPSLPGSHPLSFCSASHLPNLGVAAWPRAFQPELIEELWDKNGIAGSFRNH
jgi:hypothetical protein